MIASARRNTELSLLVMCLLVAVGGYWLYSLSQSSQPPADLLIYGLAFAAVYTVAHVCIRLLAPLADPLFFPIAALLNALGFVLIYRLQEPLENPGLAAAQATWLAVGTAAAIATLWVVKDLRDLARFRFTFAAAGLVLLLLPMLPVIGREINGARLWIRLGPLNFQPAELGKIALVIFFAGYLAERRELLAVATRRIGPVGIPSARHFGPVAVAWLVSLLIMINEKDLGSSLLFFGIFVSMLWVATARPIYLIAGGAMFLTGAVAAAQLFSHVQSRIEVWRDPFAYLEDQGYQVVQSVLALATGGAWGTGLGLGRPDLIRFSAHTDFIFSAVGEELGFVGGVAVLIAYALFAARGFSLATKCRDDFSKLLVSGLTFALSLQTVLIIGGVTRLIPLTGVTLPFMSYGGSSLLSNLILVALLLRASNEVAQQHENPVTEVGAAGGGR